MDMEDSLDSLFGSVNNSPTSQLKPTSIADEDKRREARLYQQNKQASAEAEDVDSLLSELRSARGGSMARTAANVMDRRSPSSSASSSASTSPSKGGRGGRRRRDDAGTSMAKDAEAFLESSSKPRNLSPSARGADRSRRLGGAAVSWLDAGVSTAKATSPGRDKKDQKGRYSPTTNAGGSGGDDDRLLQRSSVSARRAGQQALDTSSAASSPDATARAGSGKPSPLSGAGSAGSTPGGGDDDRRRSQATAFAAQESLKTAEQAREAAEAAKAAKAAAAAATGAQTE